MATVYAVSNWEGDFENSKSRQVENATFFCVQNHFDGRKIRRLMQLKNPAELYGAFHGICAIASRCPYRGVLLDDRGPLGAIDIADKTGFPVKSIDRALKELSEPMIGLLEKEEIEEEDGKWPLPVGLRRWAVHRSARRRGVSLNLPPPTPSDTERQQPPPKAAPRQETPPGTSHQRVSANGLAGTPSDTERHRATRREGKGTEDPPTVPQGGQQLPQELGFPEAKSFLNDLFQREKRQWSQEEDQLLSQHVPLRRDDAELIGEWFRLPLDHPVFQVTKAKHELTTFLRDFNGELDKMRRHRPLFAAAKNNGAKKYEPPQWRELFHWKYGPDINLPGSFDELETDQRKDYEASFQTFVNREADRTTT